MAKLIFSFALILFTTELYAQSNTVPWPNNPAVGIGTGTGVTPLNALQINYASDPFHNDTAILRLSNGTTSSAFGILGLMPYAYPTYSSISYGEDLVLHEHSQGDLILTNFQSYSLSHHYGAIRFATTPNASIVPTATPILDEERLTILPNGNIGIDLPTDTGVNLGLCYPRDQFQLGGGVTPYPGNSYPGAPLTMYGGNPFENMTGMGGSFPGDWRYIQFNKYKNHVTGYTSRFDACASSGIGFAEDNGGLLSFTCWPYDTSKLWSTEDTDFHKALTMQLTGSQGLQLWFMDTTANPYHHLFDVFVPGQFPWPLTRNTNGLSYFHTPLCISSDTGGTPLLDFTNFAHVNPNIGDGKTWMLAVNGAALFREAWVNTHDWPDFVFQPDYNLRSLDEFGNYLKKERHLPDIPPADSMNGTVPLGQTEEAITKQVEEMALYIVQLNKKVEALESKIESLKEERSTNK